MSRLGLPAVAALALSCSGTQSQPEMPEPPPRSTRATLVGPLCEGDRCHCRDGDDSAGVPTDPGKKRFEIRLGPNEHELWATVGNMVFYKSRERAEECYYVDLSPGSHPISLRASEEHGVGAALRISELGASGPWWYDTFDFTCGAPGICDVQSLESWKRRIAETVKDGKHDPCGSVLVRGIGWTTGRMPDRNHPGDLLVEARLKVYKFAPKHPPGDPECDDSAQPEESDLGLESEEGLAD